MKNILTHTLIRRGAFLAVLVLAFGSGFGFVTERAHSQLNLLSIPFGGLNAPIPCTCSGGFLQTIGPPRPALVYFQAGASIPYQFFMFGAPGVWTLGTFFPSGVCSVVTPTGCANITAEGTVLIEGTSLEV